MRTRDNTTAIQRLTRTFGTQTVAERAMQQLESMERGEAYRGLTYHIYLTRDGAVRVVPQATRRTNDRFAK